MAEVYSQPIANKEGETTSISDCSGFGFYFCKQPFRRNSRNTVSEGKV